MIELSINKKNLADLYKEITLKTAGIKELTSTSVLNEVGKAAFVILGERFMLAADRYAVANPKSMHHVYEWNKIGNPKARLFILERSKVMSGTILVNSTFLPSKSFVPIKSSNLIGPSTRSFSLSRHVFRNKAVVMEEGKSVRFKAQKTLSFFANDDQVFVAPGTVINIMNPGGVGVKHSFSRFLTDWYTKNAHSVIDSSGLYSKIVNEAASALNKKNAGVAEVKLAARKVSNSIGGEASVIK
jgi:hypothetical protein